jgi:hypothetical protein
MPRLSVSLASGSLDCASSLALPSARGLKGAR